MGTRRRIGTSTKSSPRILSVEFLTQNHADIVGTIIVLITVGLIFEPTSKYASKFVALQHNTTSPIIAFEAGLPMEYTWGYNDLFCIAFYTLVSIVAHGVIQQYLLDRTARRLHMSKIKHSKFNESGQLLIFYSLSILWAVEILRRDSFNKRTLPEMVGGPQDSMSSGTKLYFIVQIAYWLHCFPEFYLQRIRKEEVSQRISYVSLYLASLLGAYLFNVTRLSLVLILFHYTGEATFHLARILYFRQNESHRTAFKVWNGTFVLTRLMSITLSILVLALGMGAASGPTTSSSPSSPTPASESSPTESSTPPTTPAPSASAQQAAATLNHIVPSTLIRYFLLSIILTIQIYLMWKYLVFHLGRLRPKEQAAATSGSNKNK